MAPKYGPKPLPYDPPTRLIPHIAHSIDHPQWRPPPAKREAPGSGSEGRNVELVAKRRPDQAALQHKIDALMKAGAAAVPAVIKHTAEEAADAVPSVVSDDSVINAAAAAVPAVIKRTATAEEAADAVPSVVSDDCADHTAGSAAGAAGATAGAGAGGADGGDDSTWLGGTLVAALGACRAADVARADASGALPEWFVAASVPSAFQLGIRKDRSQQYMLDEASTEGDDKD